MPLEIEDVTGDTVYFSDVTSHNNVFIYSSPKVLAINKEQAEKIISHLQEQFKLNP